MPNAEIDRDARCTVWPDPQSTGGLGSIRPDITAPPVSCTDAIRPVSSVCLIDRLFQTIAEKCAGLRRWLAISIVAATPAFLPATLFIYRRFQPPRMPEGLLPSV